LRVVIGIDAAGRFRQSRNASAYFGLAPRSHQSGKLNGTGRIVHGSCPASGSFHA
jgi:transposase